MTLFFADLVREFSSSTGAGDFVLGGAVPGHRRLVGLVPPGARFHYCIAGVTRPEEWEAGEGELGSGSLLVRSPLASSAGGELVAFSPGLKTVTLTVGAAWFRGQEEAVTEIGDVAGLPAALAEKAPATHDHDGVYAAAGHRHDADYAAAGHDHDGAYAAMGHRHDADYAAAGHDHDGDYAAAGHDHSGVYQPVGANLTALAQLATAPDQVAYWTGSGAAALSGLSAAGRALIDDADAAAQRATLGLGTMATAATSDYAALAGATFTGTVTSPRFTNAGALGTQAGNARNHFQQFNAGSAGITAGWIAAAFGDTSGTRIVIGQFGGVSAIGSHSGNLDAWADLLFYHNSEKMRVTSAGVTVTGELRCNALRIEALGAFANDAEAAAGGVPVGGIYRTRSALMVRAA